MHFLPHPQNQLLLRHIVINQFIVVAQDKKQNTPKPPIDKNNEVYQLILPAHKKRKKPARDSRRVDCRQDTSSRKEFLL